MKKVKETAAFAAADKLKECRAKLAKLDGERTLEMQPILKKFQAEEIKLLEDVEKCETVVENYVAQNRNDLLGKAKSTVFGGLKVGFRKATASLKINVEGRDWKEVLALAKKHLPDYVVSKESLDKSNLVKAADGLQKEFKKLGVEVSQEEIFFVKVR